MASDAAQTDGLPGALEAIGEGLLRELYVYEHADGVLVIRDGVERNGLYSLAGQTSGLDELADHDGPAIIDGRFRRVRTGEYGAHTFHHPHGGQMTYNADESDLGEHDAVLLEEVDRRV